MSCPNCGENPFKCGCSQEEMDIAERVKKEWVDANEEAWAERYEELEEHCRALTKTQNRLYRILKRVIRVIDKKGVPY